MAFNPGNPLIGESCSKRKAALADSLNQTKTNPSYRHIVTGLPGMFLLVRELLHVLTFGKSDGIRAIFHVAEVDDHFSFL